MTSAGDSNVGSFRTTCGLLQRWSRCYERVRSWCCSESVKGWVADLFEQFFEAAGFVLVFDCVRSLKALRGVPAGGVTVALAEAGLGQGVELAHVGSAATEGVDTRAALHGRYVFGEFLDPDTGQGRLLYIAPNQRIAEFRLENQEELGAFVLGSGHDADGEVYILTNQTTVPFGTTGAVHRLEAFRGR